MKRLLTLSAALLVALPLACPSAARANIFCPVTIASLADVSFEGRPDTWGMLLDFDRGDTRAVRVRIDTDRTRYALDVNDQPNNPIPIMTFSGERLLRYFSVGAGERVIGAWVESTGIAPTQRLDCPITAPWSQNMTPPSTPAGVQAADRDRHAVLDGFGTRSSLVMTPTPFGPMTQLACSQPFSDAHPLAPIRPPFPPEARAVNATGVVELQIAVDDRGNAIAASVTRSSGFAPLDRAAVNAATAGRYAAASFACRPIATIITLVTGFGV
jgi:TonB family protein